MSAGFVDQTAKDRLCDAIEKRLVVELRYEDDIQFRKFEPSAVYRSTKDNICVSGTQTQNPNKPQLNSEPHVFDLSKIREVRLTQIAFTPDPRFNRFDPRYKKGIICSI